MAEINALCLVLPAMVMVAFDVGSYIMSITICILWLNCNWREEEGWRVVTLFSVGIMMCELFVRWLPIVSQLAPVVSDLY